MKKRKILIPCGVLLAAVPLFLIEVRNSCQKSYVGDVRTAARVLANLTDTLLTDIGAGMTEGTYDAYCSFHAENPLKNGFYRAEYDPKTQTLTYLTNDGVSAVTVEMMDALSDRNVLMVDLGVPRNIDIFYDDCGHGVTVADLDDLKLWHRVKTGTLKEVLARADEVIKAEYKAMA